MKISVRPSKYNRDFIRQEFAPTFRNCMEAFFILTALFAVLVVLQPETAVWYVEYFNTLLEELGVNESEFSSFETFTLLFSNNLSATASCAVSGFFPFIFYPALTLGLNTFSLVAIGSEWMRGGYTLLSFLAGILPHGIFEIPALMYSCAIGLCHCKLVTRAILKKPQAAPWREQVVSLSIVFVTIVVPLLLVAALIEAFVTPKLMGLCI